MVRLKGDNFKDFIGRTKEFQFLMVRLKGNRVYQIRSEFYEFQFLMVRLKVSDMKKIAFYIANFNSLWCD